MIAETVRSFSQERAVIETRFDQLFDSFSYPVQYGNVTILKKGYESIPTPYRGPAFVRIDLTGGFSQQQEVSRTMTTINGLININVFTAQHVGSTLAKEIVDKIFPIFNAQTFNGITTGVSSVRELPPNNGWFNINISTPYRWYWCIHS
jgi:hypothetical protein